MNNIKNNDYSLINTKDLYNFFRAKRNDLVSPIYYDREGRNQFAAKEIHKLSNISKILNIGGGGKRHLKSALNLSSIEVTEIDIQGDCDIKADLDKIKQLPFQDGEFDLACAFDVLEHLENFHLMNDELLRVSKQFVLISLPNSASEFYCGPLRNKYINRDVDNEGCYSIFYGLPLSKPIDRHRWWIYFLDIIRYYYAFSDKHGVQVEFWTEKENLRKKLFRYVFGEHLCLTLFCPNVWILIKK